MRRLPRLRQTTRSASYGSAIAAKPECKASVRVWRYSRNALSAAAEPVSWRSAPAAKTVSIRLVGLFLCVILCPLVCPALSVAEDETEAGDELVRVRLPEDADPEFMEGRVLLDRQGGGILLEGRDGRLHNLTPDKYQAAIKTGKPYLPYSHDELGQSLQAELGGNFRIYKTRHYVICSDTSLPYMRWVGAMFERLQGSFQVYWKKARVELHPPTLPLPVVLFSNRSDFAEYARTHAGASAIQSLGFYSINSNRIVLFDLLRASGVSASNESEINRQLVKAPSNVATIVHEATHQIAFNTGMNVRQADNPLWLLEGMAMYFESPDLRSRSGWRTIGTMNRFRVPVLRQSLKDPDGLSGLAGMFASDKPFQTSGNINVEYARSWAIVYFLMKTRRADFLNYVRDLQKAELHDWKTDEARTEMFEKHFGPINQVESAYLKYWMRQLR